jgi:Zn-dependent M28 family amino/carboxypeptidase
MPLFIYPPTDVVAFGAEHSSLETVVDKAATKSGFTLSPDPIPEEVIFVRSDQYPFVRKGIPAVYLMPGFASSDPDIDGREEFMHFLGNIYHTPADEVSLPFDEESAARFGLLNLELVIAIANDPKRPRWNEGDFFGEKFGRRDE